MNIPFSRSYTTGDEVIYLHEAMMSGQLAGDGTFTRKCQTWLEKAIGCPKVLLTHSCTAALEMSVILADIEPEDEVILPSYTFVSTANAVVLRGGIPVFVDIRPDTLNLDETKVEAAITQKTKAIIPVHYAGVGCEMDTLLALANSYGLRVIEDAAQGICAFYKNKALGSFGDLAAFSFHQTKNIISGEGGALVINNPELINRAEIIWEKGTNRSQFFRGEVDKYTWVDVGSSYLPSELIAAFLWAQLQHAEVIQQKRQWIWQQYDRAFAPLEADSIVQLPKTPSHCAHNAHLYYLLVENLAVRTEVIARLKAAGISAVFHYVPLHSSPAGQRFGRISGSMAMTEQLSDRLLRLPLSANMTQAEIDTVIAAVFDTLGAESTMTELRA